MEREPQEDFTLHFVLDGMAYALSTDIYTTQARNELEARLRFYFPDIHLLDENMVERIPKEPKSV